VKVILKSGRDDLIDRVVTTCVAVRGIGNGVTLEFENGNTERISLFDYDVEIEA
jgi:hypothetical protein